MASDRNRVTGGTMGDDGVTVSRQDLEVLLGWVDLYANRSAMSGREQAAWSSLSSAVKQGSGSVSPPAPDSRP